MKVALHKEWSFTRTTNFAVIWWISFSFQDLLELEIFTALAMVKNHRITRLKGSKMRFTWWPKGTPTMSRPHQPQIIPTIHCIDISVYMNFVHFRYMLIMFPFRYLTMNCNWMIIQKENWSENEFRVYNCNYDNTELEHEIIRIYYL